jgi:acyl dehydratase
MPPRILNSLDELKSLVGHSISVSDWFLVTQDRIHQFAEATGDHQWIHLDAERAKRESPYGTTIAHGFLTLSLISSLMKGVLEIRSGIRLTVNYGSNRVRFPAPVPANSKIRATVQLAAIKELPDSLEATYAITVESDAGPKPACVAEWLVRYYR